MIYRQACKANGGLEAILPLNDGYVNIRCKDGTIKVFFPEVGEVTLKEYDPKDFDCKDDGSCVRKTK